MPGFTTPEQTFRNTATSDDTELFVRADNYDDDDVVGVFAPRIKRPKPLRTSLKLLTTQRMPGLTQQGQRLPQHLRNGYRRGKQDIIIGGESYKDLDHLAGASQRHISTQSYGHVHTALPAANMIPTDGRGYIVTNSFMTGAQRKRLEQQERLERALADLEECVTANPTDVKLQGRLLHLRALQNRLEQNENTFLKSAEVGIVKEVERMLSRRRMHMVTAEFENQAKAMVESMVMSSSAGRKGGKKRGFDDGSMSPQSSSYRSEAGGTSERSSFSHPSTGGKTVPQSYYQRHKRERFTHEIEGDDNDEDEDVNLDDGQERKTYGGKTTAQDSLDYDTAKVLVKAMEGEEGVKDGGEVEDSSDDVKDTSDDNTDDGNGGANE